MSGKFTDDGLERFRRVAQDHVGDEKVPGLVALVASGDQVNVEALGTLAVGGGPPVRRDSLFRIASITKPVIAVATLALVDEGLFELDEPVDRLLPELADRRVLREPGAALDDTVPADRAVTARDLLTFTFGFGFVMEMFTAPAPLPVAVAAEEKYHLSTIGFPDYPAQPDPDTWIAGLGALPLLAQPGERWAYNTAASVLGVLAARAAGEPLPEVLRGRIFDPLDMRDTAFFTTETDRLATAYRPSPGGLVPWDEPDGHWSRPPRFPDGAGGLVSSADDLLAFARMLLRGGEPVGTPDAVNAMTSDQLTPEQKARGGLGPDFFADRSWGFGQAVYEDGSYGWDGGFGSTWRVDPGRDLTVVVLTQRAFESPDPPAVHRDLLAAARAALA